MTILNNELEITSVTFSPLRSDNVEGTGSGQILTAELATPLWQAEIITPLSSFDDGRGIRALMNDLNRPGQVFDLYDPIGKYPRKDPNGSILGSSVVRIDTVASNGTITLKGLPSGYQLSRGDYMQITYAGRRYFFETSQAATADSGGVTTVFRVFPKIPTSIPANTVVVLINPMIQCQMDPTGLEYGSEDSSNWTMSGFRIKAVQKL